MSRFFSLSLSLLVLGALSVTVACGGGSSHTSTQLSASQVQAITAEMQAGFTSASGANNFGPCVGGSSNQFCFDMSIPCSGGGTVNASAQFTDNLDANGNGQSSYNVTVVPTNCSVRNANLVLNGDPNLKFTGVVNVVNGQDMTLTGAETGAVSYGPDPQGVCESNLTMTATLSPTMTCTIKGTQCGQQVNFTCPQQ